MFCRAKPARLAFKATANFNRAHSVQISRSYIVPTATRRADFVQELYLKELKSFKPTPIKENDAAEHVQTFNLPKAPKSPEESDLAASLKEYENMAVEVEGERAAGAPPTTGPFDYLDVDEEESSGH